MKRHVPYAPPADKPLTKRQVEVLVAIAFGEVELKMQYGGGNWKKKFNYAPWVLVGVNVVSVVNILKKRKMVRAMYEKSHIDNNQQGMFCYLVPLERGWTELNKHSHMWQVPGDD